MRKILLTVSGTLLMAVSLSIFLEPGSLVTGGASGIGVILEYISKNSLPFVIPLWLSNLLVNVPLIIWAYKALGRVFTLRTLAATLLLSLFLKITAFLPPAAYDDNFINAVFGGAVMGIGVGLVLSGGATTGGSDLFAALVHAVHRNLRISTLIFITDVVIIVCGMFVFGTVKTMYSVLSVYASSAAVKLISEGAGFARVVFIMSDMHEVIAGELMSKIKRGATVLYGKGAYTGAPKNTVMVVAANREIPEIKRIAAKTDPHCFMFVSDVREVLGEFR